MSPASKPKKFIAETEFMNELVALFSESDLNSLELETDEIAIKLSRGADSSPVMMPHMMQAVPQPSTASQVAPATAPEATGEPAAPDASHQGAVKSPMVGTVYESPEPNAAAFIKEGDTVKTGQTLFIVEAMKVMNPIAAPRDGKVKKILVQNAQPVEFDQALAIIE